MDEKETSSEHWHEDFELEERRRQAEMAEAEISPPPQDPGVSS